MSNQLKVEGFAFKVNSIWIFTEGPIEAAEMFSSDINAGASVEYRKAVLHIEESEVSNEPTQQS